MNLDKVITLKMLELSKKYDLCLIEIKKPIKNKNKKIISKTIIFNYKQKKSSSEENIKETFHNKRDLVLYLSCLK